MESQQSRSGLKDLIRNSMEVSTFHAIPNIARTKKTSVKVMWILILIVSSALCGFLVTKTILQYLSYEVYNKFNVAFETPTEFPTISLCNVNPFVTEEAFDFLDNLLKKNNISYLPDIFMIQETSTNDEYDLYGPFWNYMSNKYWLSLRAKNPDVPDEKKKSFGHPIKEFIILCFFQTKQCKKELLSWYFDSVYGNCYRFNSGISSIDGSKLEILKTSQPGNAEGFQIFLYVGVPDHPLTFSFKTGAHIAIHNASVRPTEVEGIDLPVGMQTNVVVSREFIYKLPKPFNDCYNDLTSVDSYDSELYRAIIRSNQTYRQVVCFRACFQNWIVGKCNCYDLNMPSLVNIRACSTFEDLACVQASYYSFWKSTIQNRCGDQW